jgi:hypothetical protein
MPPSDTPPSPCSSEYRTTYCNLRHRFAHMVPFQELWLVLANVFIVAGIPPNEPGRPAAFAPAARVTLSMPGAPLLLRTARREPCSGTPPPSSHRRRPGPCGA